MGIKASKERREIYYKILDLQWPMCIYFMCLRSNIRESCKSHRIEDVTFLSQSSTALDCLPQPPSKGLVSSCFTAPELVSAKITWFTLNTAVQVYKTRLSDRMNWWSSCTCSCPAVRWEEGWWAAQDWLRAVLFPYTCSQNSMSGLCLKPMSVGCLSRQAGAGGGIHKMGSQVDGSRRPSIQYSWVDFKSFHVFLSKVVRWKSKN